MRSAALLLCSYTTSNLLRGDDSTIAIGTEPEQEEYYGTNTDMAAWTQAYHLAHNLPARLAALDSISTNSIPLLPG